MKISVIMPSFNQRPFIGQAVRSVLGQRGPFDLELIVVDGGSSDGTAELLGSIRDARLTWTSEPDRGQADALNKGLARASGEVIGWLNSDDRYRPGALATVARTFGNSERGRRNAGLNANAERGTRTSNAEEQRGTGPGRMTLPLCASALTEPFASSEFRVPSSEFGSSSVQWAYGLCRIVDESGRPIRRLISAYKHLLGWRFCIRRLICANFINQPAAFFRRDLAQRAGPIDPSLHYVMDYDYWLRLSRLADPTPIHRYLADFRLHGASKSVRGFDRQFAEAEQVARRFAPDRPWLLRGHRISNRLTVAVYGLLARLHG
jgi:glycosyltransferase involved in cell wall biosynthesis